MTPEEAQALVGREFIHFKGNRYRLLAIAKHSETLEPFVVYQALYGEHGVWVRPFDMFFGAVERDGYRGPRFRLKAGFITGENVCIDGGMSRQMVYHGDWGWRLDEREEAP